MNPLFRIDFSISDSLKIVRKSVLIYETIINRMQIKKRRGLLNKSDVYTLSKMDSMDKQEECGRYILLGNKREAEKLISQMSQEEQDLFKVYPIFKLYTEL